MFFTGSNFSDVYRCPACEAWVAQGDVFCKKCGRKFTADDVSKMKERMEKLSTNNFPNLVIGMSLALAVLAMIMFFSRM